MLTSGGDDADEIERLGPRVPQIVTLVVGHEDVVAGLQWMLPAVCIDDDARTGLDPDQVRGQYAAPPALRSMAIEETPPRDWTTPEIQLNLPPKLFDWRG